MRLGGGQLPSNGAEEARNSISPSLHALQVDIGTQLRRSRHGTLNLQSTAKMLVKKEKKADK